MPRKPTQYARSAESELRKLATSGEFGADAPLPTVRALGETYDVSYATISRILQRLAQEDIVWQHPNGRFYPVAERRRVSQGLPVVFLGRQIQNWSALYQEILEGVSGVCTARGCPLIILSSARLVQHESPQYPPSFASKEVQRKELERLKPSIPRACAGIVLDHLWMDQLAAEVAASFPSCTMFARDCPPLANTRATVDLRAASQAVLELLTEEAYEDLLLAAPFTGDPAVDASISALEAAAHDFPAKFQSVERVDCSTPEARRKLALSCKKGRKRMAILSFEDNVTSFLLSEFQNASVACPEKVGLVSVQGSSAVGSSVTRLRYDYRSLGREVTASLFGKKAANHPIRPSLIRGRTVTEGSAR